MQNIKESIRKRYIITQRTNEMKEEEDKTQRKFKNVNKRLLIYSSWVSWSVLSSYGVLKTGCLGLSKLIIK
jgi:hypothetical protein